VFLPIAFILGYLMSRVWMIHVAMRRKSLREKFVFLAKLCSFDEIILFSESEYAKVHRVDCLGEKIPLYIFDRPESKISGIFIVTEMYRFLMVIAAFTVSLAHGSNDVANAITPLLVTQNSWYKYKNGTTKSSVSSSGFWLGSFGIAVGLITLGKPCMKTVGKKIIKMSYTVGFCA
jgi:phosphate/sulfate permease